MPETYVQQEGALPADEMETIVSLAREYDAEVIWLFGSALEDPANARDIDLAVEGLPPENFFRFFSRLMMALPRPVDLVDLSEGPWLEPIIQAKGIRIYER